MRWIVQSNFKFIFRFSSTLNTLYEGSYSDFVTNGYGESLDSFCENHESKSRTNES